MGTGMLVPASVHKLLAKMLEIVRFFFALGRISPAGYYPRSATAGTAGFSYLSRPFTRNSSAEDVSTKSQAYCGHSRPAPLITSSAALFLILLASCRLKTKS